MLIALSIGFVSCKKDGASTTADGGSNPINPTNCDDPEGTITANLRNDSGYITVLNGTLKMNTADNFEFNSQPYHERTFVNIGEVDGLGCVENIPQSGWSNQVAVIPGNGYVVKDKYDHPYYPDDKYTKYARIYVTRYILSANYEILGAELKYQDNWMSNPKVTTSEVKKIKKTTATCGGNVTDDGGCSIIERGVCWSTSPNPTINNDHAKNGNGLGCYNVMLTNLTPGTIYFVRAYVENDLDICYGEQVFFQTLLDNVPTGAIGGMFSVSSDKKVFFSQGNLQYQASTNTWRFAENQYDYVGYENANISPNYNGWIDLFGWGTGNNPSNSSTNNVDYDTFIDWGENSISNGGNNVNTWLTLTQNEWEYVINSRNTTSGIRYAKATVNGINGVILLPDNWSEGVYWLNNTNSDYNAPYNSNIISLSNWTTILEAIGAVFLPAAGYRDGTFIGNEGPTGDYWSATVYDSDWASNIFFGPSPLSVMGRSPRYRGCSVRLVCPAE